MESPSRSVILVAATAFAVALGLFASTSSSPPANLRRQLWEVSSFSSIFSDPKTVALKGEGQAYGVELPRKLDAGWDESGVKLYREDVLSLIGASSRVVEFPYPKVGPIYVSNFRVSNNRFWDKMSGGTWEPDTFEIFDRYIAPGETTVVDFGTWIGPTLLYHGQYSKRSYGIEADPVAYAEAEYNVELNRKLNPSWANRVSVDAGCVSSPEDAGPMTMKAGRRPGLSMSGISDVVAMQQGHMVQWQVKCQTLGEIFNNYWGIERPYADVFIKIDIESYECKLIPSFYDWLKEEQYLPKMFISFHPQISECSGEDYDGVLRFLGLYDHVRIADREEYDMRTANVDDFAAKIRGGRTIVVYQEHHAEKISFQ